MKMPRLKNYFLAIPPDLYQEFEHSRQLRVEPVQINVITGQLQGRPHWLLCAQPDLADNLAREQYQYRGAVYILRIPQGCIRRDQLQAVSHSDQIWQYPCTIQVPHCAVYRYELANTVA